MSSGWHMSRLLLIALIVGVSSCGAHREGAIGTTAGLDAGNRLANLRRASRYPWTDDGRCAVREASGSWATLVQRCYAALDLPRIQFVDKARICPVAQAGT